MTHALLKCEPGTHNYQARFDERVNEHLAKRTPAPDIWQVFSPFPMDKVYVLDICTKCGDVIRRNP